MKRSRVIAGLSLLLFFVACKKEPGINGISPVTEESGYLSADQLKLDFAKTLAKAMEEPGVRGLLKTEALKQFDNDYDVLFQLVKDKEVQPGVTLTVFLNSLSETKNEFSNLAEQAPLLTIFVPSLAHFSAETWNTSTELPVVAVVKNDFSEKGHTPLPAFDHSGSPLQLASNKAPDFPVVVVKENERIRGESLQAANARATRGNTVFQNRQASFYFIDDRFNGEKTREKYQAAAFPVWASSVDQKMIDTWNLQAASQRDYVYYNILNPNDQGPLNNLYAEHVIALTFNDQNAVDHNYDDQTTDWSDGSMEFQLDVLFFNGTSALSKISKVFSVPHLEPRVVHFLDPLEIATWDMKAMGDTWKYVLNEIDPGTVSTTQHTSTSKFGTNFTLTGQFFEKIGFAFGATNETTTTNTTTIQVTTGSDFCGEAVVNFMSPVIVGYRPFPGMYDANELNTGLIRFVVMPKHI